MILACFINDYYLGIWECFFSIGISINIRIKYIGTEIISCILIQLYVSIRTIEIIVLINIH
tara:strand:- start:926 stop:1108 length:183 start_codon:yes stop_codon:yes gene_type:complete